MTQFSTVMILYFGTDRLRETLHTQVRLLQVLLEEQSDQGLHC